MTVTDRIKEIIEYYNINIDDLEVSAELKHGEIETWGDNMPTMDKIQRVAKILHIKLAYLVTGETEEPQFDTTCDDKRLTDEQQELINSMIDEHNKSENDNKRRLYHKMICKSLHETYVAKNKDYGDSFSYNYKQYGYVTALAHITEKTKRLESLYKLSTKNFESEKDTLLDLANYCIMTLVEMEIEKENK